VIYERYGRARDESHDTAVRVISASGRRCARRDQRCRSCGGIVVLAGSPTAANRQLRGPHRDRLSVGRRSSQRCVEYSNQPPGTSTTRRCARVAPQDVHYDGSRKDTGLRDVVVSDGGIASGGELERSCRMSGRSEDVLDLGSFWQGVEERSTHRVAGRARSVARRSLSRSPGLPWAAHALSRSAMVRSPPSANACTASIAARGRRPRARHRVPGHLSEFGPAEFDRRGVIRHGVILLYRADVSPRRPLAGRLTTRSG
jgi:hypothetical protein